MRGPEEWPSRRKADRIRLTGPAADFSRLGRFTLKSVPRSRHSLVFLAALGVVTFAQKPNPAAADRYDH